MEAEELKNTQIPNLGDLNWVNHKILEFKRILGHNPVQSLYFFK